MFMFLSGLNVLACGMFMSLDGGFRVGCILEDLLRGEFRPCDEIFVSHC